MPRDELTELASDDWFVFSCHPGVSCFNACCRDLNQFLMPYDILRLKHHFAMSSTDFLAHYTSRHVGPQTGLPVVTLKPADPVVRICPFVADEGCRVYDNRPSSCRIYPLVRLLSSSRETGERTVRYMLLKEPHCHGFENGRRQTVREWITHQGLCPYNEMNDAMMEIIALKNHLTGGQLSKPLTDLFDLALYDLDRFRKFLSEDRVDLSGSDAIRPDPEKVSDEDLLRFSMQLVADKIRYYGDTGQLSAGRGQ
ncbi:MAG: YkgJ family cysteine cluster protein [Desulfobacterales bacterium]|nr:YkgJ family cysteine cluster protein [Desulfobacterales bacterium]